MELNAEESTYGSLTEVRAAALNALVRVAKAELSEAFKTLRPCQLFSTPLDHIDRAKQALLQAEQYREQRQ